MSQKYCKVQVSLGIGNRKSQVQDPIEVEEATNNFPGELNTLVLNFEDAVKSLPCTDGNYTKEQLVQAFCSLYDLIRVPVENATA